MIGQTIYDIEKPHGQDTEVERRAGEGTKFYNFKSFHLNFKQNETKIKRKMQGA